MYCSLPLLFLSSLLTLGLILVAPNIYFKKVPEIREIEFGLISVGAQIRVILRGITLSQMKVNYLFLRENKSTTNL